MKFFFHYELRMWQPKTLMDSDYLTNLKNKEVLA